MGVLAGRTTPPYCATEPWHHHCCRLHTETHCLPPSNRQATHLHSPSEPPVHHLHIVDVQATGRHICGHQEGHRAALELVHCCRALPLADVAVDGNGLWGRWRVAWNRSRLGKLCNAMAHAARLHSSQPPHHRIPSRLRPAAFAWYTPNHPTAPPPSANERTFQPLRCRNCSTRTASFLYRTKMMTRLVREEW